MSTSIPGRDLPPVGLPHVDKVVHFLLYAVLGLLVSRALRRARPAGGRAAGAFALALAAIAVFGALDEWHQQWVPGRSADLLDWCADLAGATLALISAALPTPRPRQLT